MPLLPDTVERVTVTESYVDAAVDERDGTIRFTPAVRVFVAGTTITVDPVVARVVDGVLYGPDGKSPLRLVAKDATGITPTGWTYLVEPNVGRNRTAYSISLPKALGSVVLHTLSPVDPVVPGDVRVRTVEGIGPDALGNIDLPPSAGGVASVNNQTPDGAGNVTITAAHVGALTQSAGDARYVQPAALDSYATDAELSSGLAGKAAVSHTHVQSDIAGLTASLAAKADLVSGKVPQAQIPAVALVEFLGAVGSQSAMLAVTGQRGDWVNRSDTGTTWQLIADDPTQLANWQEHVYPASPVSSVAGRTGAVTLSKTDVGLPAVDNTSDAGKPISDDTQAALDGKETVGAAAAAIAAHVGASDPHSQYLTQTEGDGLYSPIGHTHSLGSLNPAKRFGFKAMAASILNVNPGTPQALALTSGRLIFAAMLVDQGDAISTVWAALGAAGSGGGSVFAGVYEITSGTTVSKVGETGDIATTLSSGSAQWKSANLITPVAAGAARVIYLAILSTLSSAPTLYISDLRLNGPLANPNRPVSMRQEGQSALPSSVDLSTLIQYDAEFVLAMS